MNVELGPHQIRALKELANGKVLKGGVGTGKSRVGLTYYITRETGASIRINGIGNFSEMATPKDIYIITTAKKREGLEWDGEAATFALSRGRPEDSFGGVTLTIDSWNNIVKYAEVKDAFFILDEQRLVGSGAWVKAFIKIAASNRWIMLSATPGDTWMDYVPIFIANGFYKNRTEFVRRHVVFSRFSKYPKIERYVETHTLELYRKRVLVEMPYERATIRHVKNVIVEHDKQSLDRIVKDRWHIYEERPLKDAGELSRVMRKLVNSDVSRIAALMGLLEKHPRLIVFYNFNYELAILRTLANFMDIPHAEWNGHKHQEIPDTERWLYFVQFTSGAEGWNCVSTDAMVFWSQNYSYRIMEQCKGRIDRMNTPYQDLMYYIFRSNTPIDKGIAQAISQKKDFNEKKFSTQFEWEKTDESGSH